MQKYISEARLLLALAIPVILAQIAQTAMGFVDTVMAGGYIHGFTAGANRPVVQRQSRGCNAGCAFDVAGGGISDF